jgi:hypothetical protein
VTYSVTQVPFLCIDKQRKNLLEMKKEIVLQRNMVATPSLSCRVKQLAQVARHKIMHNRLLDSVSGLYSRVMEQEITPAETLRILHVQLASSCLLLLGAVSLPVLSVLLCWTALALWQCRNLGRRGE